MCNKDEALKMAIVAMEIWNGKNVKTNTASFRINFEEALQACKEALEQPAQEPVAIVYSMQDGYIGQMVVKDIPHKTKLYTHPAPSWQGLSDDELDEIVDSLNVSLILDCSIADFVNAIEARLKEKNN